MTTIVKNLFTINGVVDTSQNVLSNLESLASAAGCWLTYDIHEGKWAVIINKPGSSVASFNDSNILGGINISSTGLTELYNSAEIEFPNKDIKDQKDYITVSIASEDRYPNELDNVLSIRSDLINDPIQAEYIATRELKQSRVDKVIEFRTDFSKMGLKAGEIIDVTNSALGFDNKLFRVTRIQEQDGDDGTIILSISALEYSDDVYTANLTRRYRVVNHGITSKQNNKATTSSDNQAGLPLDLSGMAKALGLMLVFNSLTGKWELSQGGQQANIAGTSAVINWTFVDGSDLDIRCRVLQPNIGQYSVDDYLGWTGGSGQYPTESTRQWPAVGVPILIWGGDNTGTGTESVAVNIEQLKSQYGHLPYFIIECRANWFGTPGLKPVLLDANIYQGGALNPSGYGFVNSGYSKARYIQGVSVFIDSNYSGDIAEKATGDLMGYFVFDVANNTAQFVNDLTFFS